MEFNPNSIEQKWKKFWDENKTYEVKNGGDKPKYYILNMFPYPSGAGLHVGHPLGYIATDIYARFKRLKGFNVLNPMGYDSFGLPAEQYAIQTGTHPAITTEKNITTFRGQLDNLGFSFDWSREVRTSEPSYYKWTQWIFMQLFNHYYDKDVDKAVKISDLVQRFKIEGNTKVNAVCDEDTPSLSAAQWNAMSEKEQQLFLLKYRFTFPEESFVNWCSALGTVLSNDEVKDGVSERGGYPVERKLMKQWSMRITAYADKLLNGLNTVDWSDSLKEQQRNWIGRSQGASVKFGLELDPEIPIEVFTTRVDTIYGVTFMVLAPEHELVASITTKAQKEEVEKYQHWASSRSDVERQAEAKKVTGAFTGAYCINPFNNERVPIYIADYVLAGYGTGAVMAVPSGDQRDWNFAKHFNLPIVPILDAQQDMENQADNTKEGKYINSGMINGMNYAEATKILTAWLEERVIGKGKIQYRLRNAVFSRQRYWGEPVPAYWKDGVPYLIDESELPLILPQIEKYLPTETGEPPLGRATDWKYKDQYEYELSTMPGWAGSSWYFYRYMDAHNDGEFASKEALNYWKQVDLYVGGTEHAVGHLLYSRFWNYFMHDLGLIPEKEYAAKLLNQGMILGVSQNIFRVPYLTNKFLYPSSKIANHAYEWSWETKEKNIQVFYSSELTNRISVIHNDMGMNAPNKVRIPISFVAESQSFDKYSQLNGEGFKQLISWREDLKDAVFVTNGGYWENGTFYRTVERLSFEETDKLFLTSPEVGKMSKSWYNTINPDDMVDKYGADCFRMYEMFLGPIQDAKPWNTQGISGVSGFLRKLWSLFYDLNTGKNLLSDAEPAPEELKVLHACIKKVNEDIERFSFNTCVSTFMVCVNGLKDLKCSKRLILNELVILVAPFAPFVSEELHEILGNKGSVLDEKYPVANEAYLKESVLLYPISINGKKRGEASFSADMMPSDIEAEVRNMEVVQKWTTGEGKDIKKVIIVPGRMVNIVA
jgi:leucyl-tRNA synthetase